MMTKDEAVAALDSIIRTLLELGVEQDKIRQWVELRQWAQEN
jgi:hypothetical protein